MISTLFVAFTIDSQKCSASSLHATFYGPNLYYGLGSSFVIKKKSLLALGKSGRVRAGAGGYGYLKHWVWWSGLLTMGFGEALNFIAYAFAPASLVTPLGALSVIVTAVLSSFFLGETLNILGKLGCSLCILGSTVVVIHAPKEAEVTSMDELSDKLVDLGFIIYVFIVIGATVVLIMYFSPRYGSRNVVVYISTCSLVGGFSVLCCKTVGLAVVALDIFNTSVVTPVYYVFFTTCVIVASAVLFKEWKAMAAKDVIGLLSGFLTVVIAIFMLHAFRDIDLTWHGLSTVLAASNSSFSSSRDDGLSSPLLGDSALT